MVEKLKYNRTLILLLLTGAVYFFLKRIAPLTAPVLLAMLFVTIFGSLLQKMQGKLRIHRQVGAVLLLLFACGILGILVWVLFSWMIGSLPDWVGGLDSIEEELAGVIHRICAVVGKTISVDEAYLEGTLLLQVQKWIDYVQLELLPGLLSQSLEYAGLVAAAGGFLVTFLIATVLLAKDYDDIMNRLLDREECHVFLEVICGVIRYLATFVRAQVIIMTVISLLSAAALSLCRIRHGVLWGVLAGLLDALPFIGTGIVLIPIAIQQFFSAKYWQAAVCVLLYVLCIFIRELLEPRLIGRRVGVHPVIILASIYAGIKLFGLWGIIGGPLGFVIIWQAYASLERRLEKDLTKEQT